MLPRRAISARRRKQRLPSGAEVHLPKTDPDGVKWLSEEELAQSKSCADEKTFDAFVTTVGGQRLDVLHGNLRFPNADYIFPAEKVIIELKTLEAEVSDSDQFREKMRIVNRRLYRKYNKSPLSLDPQVSAQYLKAFIELFRAPLARIVKKANSQIKSTKQNLGYPDHQGILLLINDNLRELPPRLMLATLARILNGSCSSVRAMIYLTNHYILIPGDEYGRILWVPLYADAEGDGLAEFVNWLGAKWFDYCESLGRPSDDRQAGPDISLAGSRAAGSDFPIA